MAKSKHPYAALKACEKKTAIFMLVWRLQEIQM
jgi:hypothetical protein